MSTQGLTTSDRCFGSVREQFSLGHQLREHSRTMSSSFLNIAAHPGKSSFPLRPTLIPGWKHKFAGFRTGPNEEIPKYLLLSELPNHLFTEETSAEHPWGARLSPSQTVGNHTEGVLRYGRVLEAESPGTESQLTPPATSAVIDKMLKLPKLQFSRLQNGHNNNPYHTRQ